jgi:ketosteroid isomerase-like protein
VVRSLLENFNEQGIESILDRVHPDFEGTVPPELSAEPDTYRGHDGIRRYFAGFEGVMKDVHVVVDEAIDGGGGRIVVGVRLKGRGVATELEVELVAWQVWTVRDGLIVGARAFETREEALREVGR